jgi:hypothetical protein
MAHKYEEKDRVYRGHTVSKVHHAGRLADPAEWYYVAIATHVSYQVYENILMAQTLDEIKTAIDNNFRKKYKEWGR